MTESNALNSIVLVCFLSFFWKGWQTLTNTTICKATTMEINNHSWILILIDWRVNSDWNFSNNVIIRLKDKIISIIEKGCVLHIVTYQISFIPEKQWNKNEYRRWKTPNQTFSFVKHSLFTAKEVSSFKFQISNSKFFLVWKKKILPCLLRLGQAPLGGRGGWGCPLPGYSQWKFFYSIYLSEIFSSRRWSNQFRYSTGENV